MSNEGGYGRKVAGGIGSTAVAQLIRICSSMGLVIIASRILSPADYGIYAMAAPIVGLAMMFQNIGFDHAIVQAKEVSDDQISSLFWMNILMCATISAVLIMISPLASIFYRNDAVGPLVATSSLLILAMAPSPLYNALLNRHLRFHTQSLIDIASSVTGFVVTIAAVFLMRSYWALLVGALATTIVSVIGFMTAERWRPRLVFQWRDIAPMVRFGGGVSVFGMATFVTRNIDNILLARVWGGQTLGYYDRAYRLMFQPLQNICAPLARNLLPVLARTRDEPERYRRAYLLFVQGIAALVIPGVIACSVSSHETVGLLLGEKWHASAPIFAWLSAATPLLLINETVPWLFMSSGQSRRMMYWGLFASATVILGFAIGVFWGAVGMAMAYFIGEAARSPLLFRLASRDMPVSFGDFARLHIVTVVCAAACWSAGALLPVEVAGVARISSLGAISYLTALAAQLASEPGRELLRIARSVLLNHLMERPKPRHERG
ncbi:polysaccharide biosynthesis protein [Sphingobium chlorophenolicum L-1]|uniref:Polysaccharide biosynthesis protein n=1 Tax=Sphingobium chlorophenolicum L-1 TaxID=690566 RepID=F6EX03_SPHCR|nr:lipopolysaccharide biosynthesis protein [Sphingobium chlorophenolicum]AEG48166.1 polysaccharide biosynthesis protein [Sphingobium chlorophenolicum L-1]